MRSKTFWISMGAVLVVAVVAIYLIIYGVSTHDEPGPLEVCWIDSVAFYSREGCERTTLIWPREQIPLKVGFGSDLEAIEPSPLDQRALQLLISELNRELGFTLFASDSPASVVIRLVPGTVEAEGRTSHMKRGDVISSSVMIQSGMHDTLLYRVLRHELLHAAGLAHDDYTLSVMYPLTPDDMGIEPQVRQIISDSDRTFLRDKYMSR